MANIITQFHEDECVIFGDSTRKYELIAPNNVPGYAARHFEIREYNNPDCAFVAFDINIPIYGSLASVT